MIRLLHLVGDSKFGGGSIIVLRLAELARSLGWNVDVLTTDAAFQELLVRAGIGVVPLDVIRRPIRPLWDVLGALRLKRFLARHPYTIVHTHTSKAGVVGRWAARRAKTPVIVHTVHGFAFHEASSRLQTLVYAQIERCAARWCDRLVTVSEYHQQWAARLGIGTAGQRVAIPNGIDSERVAAVTPRSETRRQWNVAPDETVILSTGRLAAQKGLEYLLDAAALVSRHGLRPFRLVLVGEGPLRESLTERARRLGLGDRVLLVGFRQDVGNLLAACDIVAIPSLWEGLSIALLEAMAAGKPIVTTTIGSNREATQNGRAAMLVPPADPAALAAAIIRLCEDRDLARNLSQNALAVYRECYTEERMLRQYEALYLDCLESRGIRAGEEAFGDSEQERPVLHTDAKAA